MSSPQPTSFATAAAGFLAWFERQVRDGERSPATLAMHRLHVRYLGGAIPPTTPVASIDETAVNCAADHERAGRRGQPITSGTVSKRISTLRQILAFAYRQGWRGPPPAVPSFRRSYRPRTEHLRDAGELARLCRALPPERALWVRLAVFTGQHPADVERMRAYDDADPFSRPPWMRLRNTKNRRPPRVVVMPGPLVGALRERFRAGELAAGDPIVVPWPKDARGKRLRRLAARLGLSIRRASDFRRTCGSWAAHELRSITVGLKDFLGHSNVEMLSRIYAHALPPGLAEVSSALTRAARAPRRSPLMKGLPGAMVLRTKKGAG